MKNLVTSLFGVRYPIIQAGMVWTSGWRLASAVSRAGGLGLIGAGSMSPELLREHIRKCRAATSLPFGVNLPLLYPDIEKQVAVILEEGVEIVFSSAGNPALWTGKLKDRSVKVAHVVSSAKFAQKAQAAGVDAIVAEGVEAGGHNGREETTTFCLIPLARRAVSLPLIAAGGIATGAGMLAAMALGADGVQIGSRFVASVEASAHPNFKESAIKAQEGDTQLTLKELTPVRLIKNPFYEEVQRAYQKNATVEELKALLGKGRAKRGMFEGDLTNGELEIGQVSAQIDTIEPAQKIFKEILAEYQLIKRRFSEEHFDF